eukprot:scaffold2778_cov14-Prasinocladus_malaysianus.AAC.1
MLARSSNTVQGRVCILVMLIGPFAKSSKAANVLGGGRSVKSCGVNGPIRQCNASHNRLAGLARFQLLAPGCCSSRPAVRLGVL